MYTVCTDHCQIIGIYNIAISVIFNSTINNFILIKYEIFVYFYQIYWCVLYIPKLTI